MLPAVVAVLLGLLQTPQSPAPASVEKLPLRILYAGNAGTPYTAAWERFLAAHATAVKVVSASALQRTDLDGFDLLVVDGEIQTRDAHGNEQLKSEKIDLALDELQGFPVVLVGGQGGVLSDALRLKTSWRHG